MTPGVVYPLEIVEIDEHDCQCGRVPVCAGEGIAQPVEKERPVRQPGERVTKCLSYKARLQRPAFPQFGARQHPPADVGVLQETLPRGLLCRSAGIDKGLDGSAGRLFEEKVSDRRIRDSLKRDIWT